METNENLKEIVKKMENKYRHMIEVSRSTDELEETLQHNDNDMIVMVMTMRAKEMECISVLDKEMEALIQTLEPAIQKMMTKAPESLETVPSDVKQYYEIREKVHRIVEQIIQKDRKMSERIAGSESFYAK